MKEADELTKQILQHLQYSGCYAWRQNNIAVRGRANSVKKGLADVMGVTGKGQILCIEVKIGHDRQRQEQEIFEREIKNHNGHYLIAKTFDEYLEKIRTVL